MLKPVVISLAIIAPAAHANFSLLYEYGVPTTSQNVSISTHRMEVQAPFWRHNNYFLDFSSSLGVMEAANEQSLIVNSGLGLNYEPIRRVQVRVFGGVNYLEEHRFSVKQGQTKDFGGHFQFNYAFALRWQPTSHGVYLGYRYNHMSNGGIYEQNPALNTHNLTFSWQF